MAKKQPLDLPRPKPRDWSAVDAALHLPSDDQLVIFARQVNELHAAKASTRILAPDYRLKGLWCERHIARVFQLAMPLKLMEHGNRRVAFRLHNGWTIDVIGRHPPKGKVYPDLTMKMGMRYAVDALILVCFNGWDREPEIVGWETEPTVKAAGSINTYKDGVKNYVVPWGKLRSISELAALHAPNHPLAGIDDRPYFWFEGRTRFTPPAEDEPVIASPAKPKQKRLI